ncbi:MAG: HEAT repeat domain-containing protein [Thermodesulfobacteriota bacterium]|nr:HEAT repeat domain-containing protein [Thermodesulfobacteriota bacterium]
MPYAAMKGESGSHWQKVWLTTVIAFSVVGGISVVTFAVWWLIRVSGNCGVVRFYEQAFAVILVGSWLIGTSLGVGLTVHGFVKKSRSIVSGTVIAILANLGVLLVCARVMRDVREADFSLKSTELLLQFLQGEDMDNRKLAAFELGERRAAEAVPALCAILDDIGEDINLRLNSIEALGKICTPPSPSGANIAQAVASLIKALRDRERFVPKIAAEALGRIGDVHGICPLADLLDDETKDYYTRISAAKAVWNIGGSKASETLKKAHAACSDEELAKEIGALLDNMNGL